ncbi:DUF2284 domain-containing protein [Clostridium sp. D2Q-14]|uniref:DUF2284 domain-containing protein n=1 Tax=Anaeromonas gelatinilytica TaxID=2683194 RepID=UPI00193AE8F3|nr:DUF2284 domain-containing protein [Anaeromonas gelatinilytica]MBS4535448.1 DUF2284 domain-containing protein [Anaeromonas gelatinilytica]
MSFNKYIDEKVKIYKINPKEIIFDDSIRGYCIENKCGRYNNNFMCPPIIGSVEKYKKTIKSYNDGYLILFKDIIEDSNTYKYYNSQKRLHEIVLEIENELIKEGYIEPLGFIAGECKICKPCKREKGYDECIYPDKARTSLEAVGVNVVKTVKTKGIEIVFGTNEITWIGAVLIK